MTCLRVRLRMAARNGLLLRDQPNAPHFGVALKFCDARIGGES